MDAKKLLGALTTEETGAVAAALPEEVFAAEAVRRGFAAPEAGSLAVSGAAQAEVGVEEDDPFKQDVRDLLSDDGELLTAGEQLNIMLEFWNKLGLTPPALTDEQLASIHDKVAAQPGRRVMPVPLLDLNGRKDVAERAKTTFPGNKFGNYEALWTPDESWVYGKLLRDPEATVKDGRKSYGLRYHTADGAITRSELVDKLTESSQAVAAEDGTVWLFPVMDVAVKSSRQYRRADDLHRQADITQVPESLVAMQLLHQAADAPNPDWHVDFTNEAVYELDKKGNPVAPVRVASVCWNPSYRQVNLDRWNAGLRNVDFGVRGAESGL